jgi:hypothetical protein
MSLKNILFILLTLTLVLMPATGCQETEFTAIELVPQGINLLANVQISKLVNDPDIRDAYDKSRKEPGQPQTAEEGLNEITEEIGVDLEDFSQAIVFADTNTIEDSGYIGFIAEGDFNEKGFISSIEEKTREEFSTSDYKDYTIYAGDDEFAIAFLNKKTLLGGSMKAVKDVIDVSEGDRKPVTGTILDTYRHLDEALIKVAFELPEEAREELTEEPVMGDIPISLEPFADIDIVGFSLNKEQENLSVRIEPHFLSTDSAQDAGDTISGAISLFKGMLQEPSIKELLGKVDVTVTDTWMTIAFEITLSEIEELMETFN